MLRNGFLRRCGPLLAVLVWGTVVAACSQGAGDTVASSGRSVTVFAASSLKDAFTEIAARYEEAHPGTTVTLNFAASSELVAQINNGAPADVFASADIKNMEKLSDGTAAAPVVFATNRLAIIVQQGNPRGISTLGDLAGSDVLYVTAAPEVPIGKYAQEVLDRAGITVRPRSLEANVKGIVSKVVLGEADAGIVYLTDVLAAGTKAEGIEIPDGLNVEARYPIAVPSTSGNRAAGAAFIAYLASADGRAVLVEYGFGAP